MKHAPEVVAIVLIVLIAGAVLFGMRWFNAAAVVVTIHQPQQGTTCAVATSADGVGIACWKDQP